MLDCANCGKTIEQGQECYQVMIYESNGKQEFVKTCCKNCAEKIKNSYYKLHEMRANDIKHQCIQRMSND